MSSTIKLDQLSDTQLRAFLLTEDKERNNLISEVIDLLLLRTSPKKGNDDLSSLIAELKEMTKRLEEISQGAYDDMEAAHLHDFIVSESIFSNTDEARTHLLECIKVCEDFLTRRD